MINQPGKKKLFVSLSATVQALKRGIVTDEDLDEGLFQFNSWNRELLLDSAFKLLDGGQWPFLGRIGRSDADHFGRVARALQKAEGEGRVSWVGLCLDSFERLNELLVRHGHEPVERMDKCTQLHVLVKGLNVVNHQWLRELLDERDRTLGGLTVS